MTGQQKPESFCIFKKAFKQQFFFLPVGCAGIENSVDVQSK